MYSSNQSLYFRYGVNHISIVHISCRDEGTNVEGTNVKEHRKKKKKVQRRLPIEKRLIQLCRIGVGAFETTKSKLIGHLSCQTWIMVVRSRKTCDLRAPTGYTLSEYLHICPLSSNIVSNQSLSVHAPIFQVSGQVCHLCAAEFSPSLVAYGANPLPSSSFEICSIANVLLNWCRYFRIKIFL